MSEEKVKKAGIYYLIVGACLMILATISIYVCYLHPFEFRELNSFIRNSYVLAFVVGFSIIISFVNIPIFGVTGVIFLFKRKLIWLVLFMWAAVTFFILEGRKVGDAW